MAPSIRLRAGHCLMTASLLGIIVLGVACLRVRNQLESLAEQNVALAAINAELRDKLTAIDRDSGDYRATVEQRISRLENVGKDANLLAESPLSDINEGKRQTADKTLTITITATDDGEVGSITVGLAKLFDGRLDAGRLRQFDRRLKDVFAIEGVLFDRVLLRVGKTLDFGELMKVIEVCTWQKMADGSPVDRISFVALNDR